MALADALAPECIVFSVRKDRISIQAVQGEHTRVPAHGNDADFTAFFCRRVNICKMLRDPCVSVKAVDDIEHTRILRRLLRKIRRASAAEDHYIDLIFPLRCVLHVAHRSSLCQDAHCLRSPAGEYRCQFHVRVLFYRTLDPSAEISIA